MRLEYTKEEILAEIDVLRNTFDVVRIVDPIKKCEVTFDDDTPQGSDVTACKCYSIWDNGCECFYCVSAHAYIKHGLEMKIEFKNDKFPSIVFSRFICIDKRPLALEMVAEVKTDTILSAVGVNKFLDQVTRHNAASYCDYLTHAYNRKFLGDQLPILLGQSCGGKLKTGIVYCDIDHMKDINDTFGHAVGDRILCEVTDVMRRNISERRGDFVCRVGGDEFVIVFNGIEADTFSERVTYLIKAVNNHDYNIVTPPGEESQDKFKVSISAGGILSDELGSDASIDKYIDQADKRLYKAKNAGRNRLESTD